MAQFKEKQKNEVTKIEKPIKSGRWWWNRTPCMVLFDFEAIEYDEIDLKEGTLIDLIDETYSITEDGERILNFKWALIKSKSEDVGWVPRCYIEPLRMIMKNRKLYKGTWYMTGQTQTENTKNILANSKPGTFIIIPTKCDEESHLMNHILHIKTKTEIETIQIIRDSIGYFMLEGSSCRFPNLFNLVNRFHTKCVQFKLLQGPDIGIKTETINISPVPAPDRPVRGILPVHRDIRPPKHLAHLFAQYDIPNRHIRIDHVRPLGRGNFATVYKGIQKCKGGPREVAVKQVTRMSSSYVREAEIMFLLRHSRIIELYGVCRRNKSTAFVMEFMKSGSLRDYLQQRLFNNDKMDIYEMLYCLSQIADAMEYMERKFIIHRDLAARNCLVSEKDSGNREISVKVSDFGLALTLETADSIVLDKTTKNLPYRWLAIEAWTEGKFSIKSDVWAFGVLLYEVVTLGGMPYAKINNNDDVLSYLQEGNRLEFIEGDGTPELQSIGLECMNEDPVKRPSFANILYAVCELLEKVDVTYTHS